MKARILSSAAFALLAVAGTNASAQIVDVVGLTPPSGGSGAVNSHMWTGGAPDSVLWDNGPVFDLPGPPPLSQLISPNSTFGFGAQTAGTTSNAVADNFTVSGGGWNLTQLTFFMYQTGATSFTFTGLNYQITNAHGDPIAWTAGTINNGGLVAYRVQNTTPTNTQRPIFAIQVPVNLFLGDGNYVLRWQAAGTLTSGPWQPPVVPTTGGNGTQSLNGAAFNPAIDVGGNIGVDFPFLVEGTVVPAPGSLAILGLGGLLAARRRRN